MWLSLPSSLWNYNNVSRISNWEEKLLNLQGILCFFLILMWQIYFLHASLLNCVWLFATFCTVAGQAPLSMGLSRQEYWSEVPFLHSDGSSRPRDRTRVSCVAGRFFIRWAIQEAPLVIFILLFSLYKPNKLNCHNNTDPCQSIRAPWPWITWFGYVLLSPLLFLLLFESNFIFLCRILF